MEFKLLGSIVIILVASSATSGNPGKIDGPSSPTEFLHEPENMTIPEGDVAIFKCKLTKAIHRCRWYYLEEGLDFFTNRVTPVMVKDFVPKNLQDCSIKLKKVRQNQEGQWICQALDVLRADFIVSRPGLLKVITEEEAEVLRNQSPREGRRQEEEKAEFLTEGDKHIQTTYIGGDVTLDCLVNRPLSTCSWVMPHGNVLHHTPYIPDTNSTKQSTQNYVMKGNLEEGNCSLTVQDARLQDEGNWRCVAQIKEESDDTHTLLGPMIHLHLMELSHATAENAEELTSYALSTSTMIYIVICLAILIIIAMMIIFYYLYTRKSSRKDEKQTILPSANSVSTGNYSQKWIQKLNMTFEPQLGDNLKKTQQPPINYTDLSHYNQYLDMNCSASTVDGYIVMPGSGSLSSASSQTTTSTLPMDRSRTLSSATTTSNLSNSSNNVNLLTQHLTFNNRSFQKTERPVSLYSSGHLYEEIPENKFDIQFKMDSESEAATTPLYTNLTEDQEGYMIPQKKESKDFKEISLKQEGLLNIPHKKEAPLPDYAAAVDKPPSYCKVGEVEPEKDTLVVNPEYGINLLPQNLLQNYDVPRGSSESLASNKSVNQEKALNYDVPRPTSTTATVTNDPAHPKVGVSLGSIPGTIV